MEAYGIGAIALAIISGSFAFQWKIWKDTSDANKETQKLLVEIIQRTASAQEKSAVAQAEQTAAIREQSEVLSKQSDVLSKQDITLTLLLATLRDTFKKQ